MKTNIDTRVLCAAIVLTVSAGCVGSNQTPEITFTSTPDNTVQSPRVPPTSARDAPGMTSQECHGDTDALNLEPGWQLLWQRVFQHPIAEPPVVSDSQLVLLERANPFSGEFLDTLWVLDPQTSVTQWRFDDIRNPGGAYLSRWIRTAMHGQEYFAVRLQYLRQGAFGTVPDEHVVVLDRSSGQEIYADALQALDIAVSNDALYFYSEERRLHRIDLPSGETRWQDTQAHFLRNGIFPTDAWLYSFVSQENMLSILRHDPLAGTVTAQQDFNLLPIHGNVLTQDQTAVVRSEMSLSLIDVSTLAAKWTTAISYRADRDSNAFWNDLPTATQADEAIYIFDIQDNLVRVSETDGRVTWSTPSPSVEPMSRPAVSRDLVYVLFADGTLRAFSTVDGSPVATVMKVPLWYWTRSSSTEWRDLVGGLAIADDILIVATGCRSVYAIQQTN